MACADTGSWRGGDKSRPRGWPAYHRHWQDTLREDSNVVSLRSFLAFDLDKGNGLALLKSLKAATDNGPEMDKQIATFFALDKTVSLRFVEPLNGSFLLM